VPGCHGSKLFHSANGIEGVGPVVGVHRFGWVSAEVRVDGLANVVGAALDAVTELQRGE
jgi:hypothetical protein